MGNKEDFEKFENDEIDIDMKGKNIIITGSSDGIGKETAKRLIKMNGNVYFACRNKEKTMNVIKEIQENEENEEKEKEGKGSVIEFIEMDLNDLESVRKGVKVIIDEKKIEKIDVLINNAGIGMAVEANVSKQGYEVVFAVNYLSHFLLTSLLIDKIVKSNGRIINVSSLIHKWAKREDFNKSFNDKCENHQLMRYGRSKLCMHLFTKYLQRKFDEKQYNCQVFTIHPGAVKTKMQKDNPLFLKIGSLIGYPFFKTANVGADSSVYLSIVKNPKECAGKYYVDCKAAKENPLAFDEKLQNDVWEQSEEMIKQKFFNE